MEFSALINDFLDDAEGHLKVLDGALLTLETRGFDRDIIVGALGALHTLKGNSGMMGFESLKAYIHGVEEILKKVEENGSELDSVMDVLLDSVNVLRNVLQGLGKDPAFNADLTEEILLLRQHLRDEGTLRERQALEPCAYLGAKTDTIKVDFKKLDNLLNLAGELLICKTRLNRLETQISAEMGNKPLSRELNEGLGLMGKTISGLQEGIMRARMLPVRHVFQKFQRMVRDLSKAQGKEVLLAVEGEDTEIDKTIIDEMEEPLMHLIRNAIDHGIETPRERVVKGKDRQAVITLAAKQESNYVAIEVRDDGRGISLEEIRAAGIRKGLLEAADMFDKNAVLSLIFSPGFTTKEEVTDVSGRGIGLDVVSRNISKLNGHITADSTDKGTSFTIKLPLSLAIIPALMAEAGGEVYAIPMSAVAESVKVKEEDIHLINNREVIRFRERVLPVVRLGEFFGLGARKNKRFYLVILGKAERSLAVAVDRLRGKQEIVIKPLDETFGKSYGISGASILGDGRIVLIIDVMAFWNNNGQT
jgi:two-component system chemotaxis sensor kinase CheA